MVKRLRANFLGRVMAQSEKAIPLFERTLIYHNIARIMELGTYRGNLSLYFLLYCLNLGKEFYTYDIVVKWKNGNLKSILDFKKYFYPYDVFEHEKEISDIIRKDGITFLFCDGGDKERELKTYAPYMKVGDIISAHDWGVYTKGENVIPTLEQYGFKEIHQKECDEEGNIKMFMRYG